MTTTTELLEGINVKDYWRLFPRTDEPSVLRSLFLSWKQAGQHWVAENPRTLANLKGKKVVDRRERSVVTGKGRKQKRVKVREVLVDYGSQTKPPWQVKNWGQDFHPGDLDAGALADLVNKIDHHDDLKLSDKLFGELGDKTGKSVPLGKIDDFSVYGAWSPDLDKNGSPNRCVLLFVYEGAKDEAEWNAFESHLSGFHFGMHTTSRGSYLQPWRETAEGKQMVDHYEHMQSLDKRRADALWKKYSSGRKGK